MILGSKGIRAGYEAELMKIVSAISIVSGTAVGRIRYIGKTDFDTGDRQIADTVAEAGRFEEAGQRVISDIRRMRERAEDAGEKETADILEAHELLISDRGLTDAVLDEIAAGHCAEFSVEQAFTFKADMLRATGDEYLATRADDLNDLKNSLLAALTGAEENAVLCGPEKNVPEGYGGKITENDEAALSFTFDPEKYIIAAVDLLPSQLLGLDRSRLAGIALKEGSPVSHTAIIARSLGIPMVIGCAEVSGDWDGHIAIIRSGFPEDAGIGENADHGMSSHEIPVHAADSGRAFIIIDPDENLLSETAKALEETGSGRMSERARRIQDLRTILGGIEVRDNPNPNPNPDQSPFLYDKDRIRIYTNIALPDEAADAVEARADGIGLFRTEFLYIGRDSAPSEEEQFNAYRHVLEKLAPRPVIIRTFDLGADKIAGFLNGPATPVNAAFGKDNGDTDGVHTVKYADSGINRGLRGINLALRHKDLFKTQLRALIRASKYGDLGIMFPMIATVGELRECKRLLTECCRDISFRVGTMIETPAAALCAEELAAECDFFSIGTNDLMQYTYAGDRLNSGNVYAEPDLCALFKLIGMAAEAAHKAGIPVGVCGELAASPEYSVVFAKLGIDYLSV